MPSPVPNSIRLRALARSGWIHALGFGLGAFFVYVVYYVVLNGSVPSWWTDSYEYAQVGRNVAQGLGLVTSAPHVVEAWLLKAQPLPLPYLLHDPGQPLLLAVFFKLFGAVDATVGWATGTFYILIPPLTYVFARRAFNPTVAAVAAFLAVFNNQLIAFGMTGLSEVPYAFFLTCCLFSLYRHRAWWDLVLTGALFGWLVVLRSNSLPFVVLGGLFVLLDPPEAVGWRLGERLRQMLHDVRKPILNGLLFTLGFGVVFVPSAARNMSLIQNPLYNAASIYSLVFYTNAIPGKSSSFLSMPGLDIDPIEFLSMHPDQLVSKMEYQLSRTFEQLWEGGIDDNMTWVDAGLIVLLLVSVFLPRREENARQKYLRWLVYLCVVSALLAGALTNLRWRHVYGFIPIILIMDADLLLYLLRAAQTRLQRGRSTQLPVLRISLTLILAALATLGLVAAQRATVIGDAENSDYVGIARWLERKTTDDALVLAEQGNESFGMQNSLAWYTGREVVEYSDFTVATIPTKTKQPVYLLLISTDTNDRRAILASPDVAGYTEIAQFDREDFPEAVLYKLPSVSLATPR